MTLMECITLQRSDKLDKESNGYNDSTQSVPNTTKYRISIQFFLYEFELHIYELE